MKQPLGPLFARRRAHFEREVVGAGNEWAERHLLDIFFEFLHQTDWDKDTFVEKVEAVVRIRGTQTDRSIELFRTSMQYADWECDPNSFQDRFLAKLGLEYIHWQAEYLGLQLGGA